MRFTVNAECTPEEARTFLGLPDVKPMQEEVMQIMQDKIKQNMDRMDPEQVWKMWMPSVNQGVEQFNSFFKSIMTGTGPQD